MPFPLIAAAAAAIPSLIKAGTGIAQRNRARGINPVDPGYQVNDAVIENARRLSDRSANYTLPGMNNALADIDALYGAALNSGIEGASSSNDILDAVTKLSYGAGQNRQQLLGEQVAGADQAYMQSLSADALAGEEAVKRNAWQRERFNQQTNEKAALNQAGNTNLYGAADDLASAATTALMYNSTPWTNSSGTAKSLGSSFSGEAPGIFIPNTATGRRMINPNVNIYRPTL